jgi:hypothetical protein
LAANPGTLVTVTSTRKTSKALAGGSRCSPIQPTAAEQAKTIRLTGLATFGEQ